jgi:hypothetical protein
LGLSGLDLYSIGHLGPTGRHIKAELARNQLG